MYYFAVRMVRYWPVPLANVFHNYLPEILPRQLGMFLLVIKFPLRIGLPRIVSYKGK